MSAPAILMAVLGCGVLVASYITWRVRDLPKARQRREEQDRG